MGIFAVAGAGAAAGGMAALMFKSSDAAGRINDLSQKLMLSTDGFQEWEYVLGQNSIEIESLQGGVKKLADTFDAATNGNDKAKESFERVGLSLDDLKGKTPEQMLDMTIKALQGVKDPAEKAALANDLLGKSGSELAPILNLSGVELDNYKQKAHDLGIVMSEDAIKAGDDFGDKMDDVKSSLGAVGNEIGLTVMPAVQGFLDWILANMPAIKENFNVILSAAGDAVKWIKDNMDWLIPVLTTAVGIFAGFQIMSGINTLMLAFSAAQTAITTAGGLMNIVLAANPFTLIAIAIGVLIGIGVTLWMNWDKIKEKAEALWAKIKEVWNNIKEKTTEVFNEVKEKITEVFTNIKNTISEKIQAAKDKVTEIFNGIKDTITEKVTAAKDKVLEAFTGIKDGITEKLQAANDKVSEIFDNIKTSIGQKITAAKNTVSTNIDKIKDLFNFQFEWPKLKMPTFSISGSMNPLNWLRDGVPKLSVNWNAAGGIFSKPTIFGTSAGFQGVGESGPEAIMPLSKLQTMLDWNSDKALLAEMVGLLKDIKAKSNVIALDGDKLVGGVYDRLDEMVAFKQRENELAYGG